MGFKDNILEHTLSITQQRIHNSVTARGYVLSRYWYHTPAQILLEYVESYGRAVSRANITHVYRRICFVVTGTGNTQDACRVSRNGRVR